MPGLVQVMELLKQRGCNEEFEPNPAMLADGMVEFLPCRTLSADEMEAQMYGGAAVGGGQATNGGEAKRARVAWGRQEGPGEGQKGLQSLMLKGNAVPAVQPVHYAQVYVWVTDYVLCLCECVSVRAGLRSRCRPRQCARRWR